MDSQVCAVPSSPQPRLEFRPPPSAPWTLSPAFLYTKAKRGSQSTKLTEWFPVVLRMTTNPLARFTALSDQTHINTRIISSCTLNTDLTEPSLLARQRAGGESCREHNARCPLSQNGRYILNDTYANDYLLSAEGTLPCQLPALTRTEPWQRRPPGPACTVSAPKRPPGSPLPGDSVGSGSHRPRPLAQHRTPHCKPSGFVM